MKIIFQCNYYIFNLISLFYFRELSELGLNFDREEPEMRIFSESESLVSSPRVGKENVPPSSGAASRRIMRARPEEFSSQTNSVNPSPKKQPRLNLLLSPSAAAAAAATTSPSNWSQANSKTATAAIERGGSAAMTGECHGEACHGHNGDESCCKRYKLEDQLSDIQYIDCGTPEHTMPNPQTMYASVQVHTPPKQTPTHSQSQSKSSLYSATADAAQQQRHSQSASEMGKSSHSINSSSSAQSNTRYSYPSVQLGSKRKDQDAAGNNNAATKERFSYPGSGTSNDRRYSSKEAFAKMLVEEQEGAIQKLNDDMPLTKPR